MMRSKFELCSCKLIATRAFVDQSSATQSRLLQNLFFPSDCVAKDINDHMVESAKTIAVYSINTIAYTNNPLTATSYRIYQGIMSLQKSTCTTLCDMHISPPVDVVTTKQ